MPRAWGVRRYGFHGTSHAYVVARGGARCSAASDVERDRAAPRQRRVRDRGRRRAQHRHLDGADAAGGAGDGHALGRRRPGAGAARPPHAQPVHRRDRRGPELAHRGCSRWPATTTCARSSGGSRAGDAAAELALDVYCYRIRKYVGAYLAALGGADAIAFTAGVGENDAVVRARSLAGLERLGIVVDSGRNEAGETVISPDGAAVTVLVIATDEELEMATQAAALVSPSARARCPIPPPTLTLLHNPHCPTSVHALDALEEAGAT